MATLQPKQLYFGNDVDSNVYTSSNSVGDYTIVKNISICTIGSGTTFSIHILGAAGTPGSNNKILNNVSTLTNQTITYDTLIVLSDGQKIHVAQETGSSFTTLINGVEYTA